MLIKKNNWIINLLLLGLIIALVFGLVISNQHQEDLEINSEEQGSLLSLEYPNPEPRITLLAVGDLSFSRGVEMMMDRNDDLYYPFRQLEGFFQSADLSFANLESPLTPGRVIQSGEMIFRGKSEMAEVLATLGIDIVSLANNHTPNFGEKGLKDTFNSLTDSGVLYVGAGETDQAAYAPVYLSKSGLTLAFIAHNDSDVVPASYRASSDRAGTALMDKERLQAAILEAKEKADLIIVSLHSGTEYVPQPNSRQTDFARAAIDYGADLVIGHHPHVVQTMEQYQGKYIFYSLGNFVFDQSWSQETKEGLAIELKLSRQGVIEVYFWPVVMEKLAQPRLAKSAEAEKILARLAYPLDLQPLYYWDGEKEIETVIGYLRESEETSKEELGKLVRADLDQDGIIEDYLLSAGQLQIIKEGQIIWQSPEDWQIDDFQLADINNDGVVDINLSLWKPGSFASSQPFWLAENDLRVKNHFFVLDYNQGDPQPLWGSSNLEQANCQFIVQDLDGDGFPELLTVEGEYQEGTECQGKYLAIWRWNGWGFANEWRSEAGEFKDLILKTVNQQTYFTATN
ncbi:MAG: CapA family protein [Patescibacteria group bacterium]|jgi:poly-gamma-glutamate synthesis protein (capsule biosynthesis protein)